jgi:hypothetical protein
VALWCSCFAEAGADARQERSRNFGIGGRVKASIDGGEEGLLLGERGAARIAGIEVRPQFTLRLETRGGGFD